MARECWRLGVLGIDQDGRSRYVVVDNEGVVGALFSEVAVGGEVVGLRFAEDGVPVSMDASSAWAGLVGVKEAFRADARDRSARVN